MSQDTKTQLPHDSRNKRAIVPSAVTLALRRSGQVRGILVLLCLGVTAAVMLVCTIGLYAQVVMSAGLRSTLSSAPTNTDIVVRSTTGWIERQQIEQTKASLDDTVHESLGSFAQPGQLSLESQPFPLNI